ncbi:MULTISPECIES: hypothetical protein [Bacillus subtilis group]|uniref:hypothetical protein n=1 Tax=Bacillus subtilis group TaxID=653685 RepID=UPI0021D82979|nr:MULTISPECIES: hypothetical protein [Bacillus subtilis group]MCY9308830.1 hypothetical protein [Bacillus inaquosorum]
MANKQYIFNDSENFYNQRKTDEELWTEIGDLAQEQYKDLEKKQDGTSGKKAISWQDSGRGCVRCGGSLMVFEETDNGYVLLECRSCGYHQYDTDLKPYTDEEVKQFKKEAKVDGSKTEIRNIPDELFRTIPDILVLQYMEMREKSNQGN